MDFAYPSWTGTLEADGETRQMIDKRIRKCDVLIPDYI